MRITGVELRRIRVPYGPDGYNPSWLPGVTQHYFPQTLVRLFSDEGLVGVSATNSFGPEVLEANRTIAPLFLGRRLEDRADLDELWSEIADHQASVPPRSLLGITLEEAAKSSDDRSISWSRILWNLVREPGKMNLLRTKNITLENRFAYLNVALWDLLGKFAGKPVAELMGKERDRVRAYVSTGEVIDEGIVDFLVSRKEEGVESVKLRVNDPEPDGEEFDHLRTAVDRLGPDCQIGVDANQGWSLLPPYWSRTDALEAGRVMDELGVDWLEEPLGCLDLEGLRTLSENLDLEVVGGELESGHERFRELVEVYDTLNPDVCMSTGFSYGANLASLASTQGRGYTPHTWDLGPGVAAGVQLACAMEECDRLEYPWDPAWPPSYRDSILAEPISLTDGFLELPEAPGLGVELDMDVVEDATRDVHRVGTTGG